MVFQVVGVYPGTVWVEASLLRGVEAACADFLNQNLALLVPRRRRASPAETSHRLLARSRFRHRAGRSTTFVAAFLRRAHASPDSHYRQAGRR
jgi:hypothetical protein